MSKRKSMAPRNQFVAAAKFRKAGRHDKTKKALRRAARIEMQKGVLAEWRGSGLLIRTRWVRIPQTPPSCPTKADHGLFPLCSSLVAKW